jgi:Fe-S-cluster containining protein
VPRAVSHRYADPLDRVWIACAARIGLRVARDPDAFATTDGEGRLLLATREHLDADDCLAQMILHELCHSLVEGPESLSRRDWGLDNVTGADDVREHACLRLQKHLLAPHGLARMLAPTTDFRAYWDALGADPFAGDDASVPLARRAASRAASPPWGPHLEAALEATASIARAAAEWDRDPESLFSLVDPPRARHPSGLPLAAPGTRAADETCGSCAWRSGRRCAKAARAVRAAAAACERWEPSLECGACAACCREAFDTLVVGARERVAKRHPLLVVVREDGTREMPRPGGRCAALEGERPREACHAGARDDRTAPSFSCRIYADRPKTCRDFEVGGENCLLARRRVGLSV